MTMGERLNAVRKANKLTLEKFGEKIGMSPSSISDIEKGRRELTKQTLLSVCREYGVNEDWLRNGTEPMFTPQSQEDEIAAAVRRIASGRSEDFKRRFVLALAGLSEEHWELLEQKMREIVGDRPIPDLEDLEATIYQIPWFLQPMSAGTGEEAGQEEPDPLEIKKEPPKGTSFVARVKGNSMEPTYHNGDLVFVHATEEIPVGRIGVFFMDGHQWIKELGDGELISHNPAYEPIPMREDIRCQGLVLGVCDESYFE